MLCELVWWRCMQLRFLGSESLGRVGSDDNKNTDCCTLCYTDATRPESSLHISRMVTLQCPLKPPHHTRVLPPKLHFSCSPNFPKQTLKPYPKSMKTFQEIPWIKPYVFKQTQIST